MDDSDTDFNRTCTPGQTLASTHYAPLYPIQDECWAPLCKNPPPATPKEYGEALMRKKAKGRT